MPRRSTLPSVIACSLAVLVVSPIHAAPRADGQLEIEVVDIATGQPIPARLHLLDARKRPVKLNLPGTAEFGGHFYIDQKLTLPLRRGQFTFEIDAGPEYRAQSGHFEIERHADDSKRIDVTRFAHLDQEGWFAADLDFDRPPRDMPLILRAEHLHDVQLSRFAQVLPRGLVQPVIEKPVARRDGPAEIQIAPAPEAWNLPVWLAGGKLDAIQLIHRHSGADERADRNGDTGRPRDQAMFPGRFGRGRWAAEIYYHVLNCGFRLPPVAGSGSGANDHPVGANRVYVHCGDRFTPEAWWQGIELGRVFVTNGPLLRPSVEGQPPGYVFHLDNGNSLSFEIGLNLSTRVPVEYLEIIKNGNVDRSVRLDEWKNKKGRLPPVEFDDSGWFLVRAVTTNPKTYQFASSGPYYVEKANQPRISRGSVKFFLDWIDATTAHIQTLPKLSNFQRNSLLAEQALAREFFQQLLATANTE